MANENHAATDPRLLRCLDGLHYSFLMLEDLYTGLFDECLKIQSDPRALVRALWRAWSFVDVVYRVRQLAQGTPGLSARTPELVLFLQRTEDVDELRHYAQHLRNELSRPPTATPVWGALSWAVDDPPTTFTAIFGSQVPGTGFASSVYDIVERRWVSKVSLGTEHRAFNFDPVMDEPDPIRWTVGVSTSTA